MSTVSVGCSEGHDRDVDLASLKDPFHYFKCLRPPFIFTMFKYNRAEWRWILLGLIVSLGYGASQPIFGLFFARVYDATAEPDADRRQRLIRNYALLCFFSGLAGGITQFLMSLSFAKSGEALTVHMRKLTLKAILRQEMNYFDEETNSVGALITRLSSDAGALKVIHRPRSSFSARCIDALGTDGPSHRNHPAVRGRVARQCDRRILRFMADHAGGFVLRSADNPRG